MAGRQKNNGKQRKKTTKKAPTSKPSWLKKISLGLLKLSLAGLVAIVLYLIYLDAKISEQFDGAKWQLPAQIYARAMTFYPGQYLSQEEVIWELKRLNYSEVNKISNTGQYQLGNNVLRIYRRGFEFVEGPEEATGFDLVFGGKRLVAIKNEAGHALKMARLEPVQIARIANETNQDREFVPISHVPEMVKNTLLLVEDRDFYQHHGVSMVGIARALYTNLRAGRTVQGGSTLTQQLAKNFYLSSERTITRKINEAFMAMILDYRYSKDEILEAYLNEIYLGQSLTQAVHGFGLASEFYFAKPLNELEFDQIALLVAMVKGPSYYNPRRFPERAMARRDLVLRLMVENQLISSQEYKAALERPILVEPIARSSKREHPGYMELVDRELKQILGSQQAIDEGVRVFTYFDLQKQEAMEKSLEEGLPYLERLKKTEQLEAAMVAVNTQFAGISALVGGRNHDFNGFNRALDAKRNIGSLIKPAIYITAFETGQYDLGTLVNDSPLQVTTDTGETWSPSNFDDVFRGDLPLYDAFSNSINLPAVRVGLAVGLDKVKQSVAKLGVEEELNRYPSLLLGAQELSSYQVAQMYTSLANDGLYQKLTSISAITDSVGVVKYQHKPAAQRRFSTEASYLTKYAMQKVTREGTAKRLKQHFPTIQLAGKTGSTNNLRDSWFAGFDQNTVTVTWVGRDDNKPTKLTGSVGALELYIRYLKRLNPESIATERPDSIEWAFVSTKTGKQTAPGCGEVIKLPVRASEFERKPRCEKQGVLDKFKKLFD